VIGTLPISENGVGKPKTGRDDEAIGVIGSSGVVGNTEKNGHCLSDEQVREYRRLVAEGMMPEMARALVRGEKVEL
jgi:hypothetical protein